jgi:SAM-dependent methyltransferase
MLDRLRSAWHGFWFAWSERTGRMREPRPEAAAGMLPPLVPEAATRIADLKARYGVAFETKLGTRSALTCYEYLDWIDAAYAAWRRPLPRPRELHDVGCGGFAYARVLQLCFAPATLVGVDVEGYRRLRDGASRRERVLGHLADLPHAEFVVADYARLARRADFVTAFFPFVTPGPLLAWRLPLSLLRPEALFAGIARNLEPGGELLMANHGEEEAGVAAACAERAGLRRLGMHLCRRLVDADAPSAVLSRWSHVTGD